MRILMLGLVMAVALGGCRRGPTEVELPAAVAAASEQDDMVRIEPGTFRMGSPEDEEGRHPDETQVDVEITRAFFLGRYEVTQGEWRALMGNNPSEFSSCGDRCPVETVGWWDAVAYANARSRQEGLPECYVLAGCSGTPGRQGYVCREVTSGGLDCIGYRLPTEAEWEYGARAGTTGPWYGEVDAVAWWGDNSGDRTREVGGRQANAWGLHDMPGNVWEWTNDWYTYRLPGGRDPVGPGSGSYRVARGGSWYSDAVFVRAAVRNHLEPANRRGFLGLRLARSTP
jgi:formylglycine-generating enzyme required for sulfatase activity